MFDDSPARNSRSAEKRRIQDLYPLEDTASTKDNINEYLSSPKLNSEGDNATSSSETSNIHLSDVRWKESFSTEETVDQFSQRSRMFDSPARNTRSANKRLPEDDNRGEDTATEDINLYLSISKIDDNVFESSSSQIKKVQSSQKATSVRKSAMKNSKYNTKLFDSLTKNPRSADKRRTEEGNQQEEKTATDNINAYMTSPKIDGKSKTTPLSKPKRVHFSGLRQMDSPMTKQVIDTPKSNSVRLVDSPARNTRSAEKRRIEEDNQRHDTTADDVSAFISSPTIHDNDNETSSIRKLSAIRIIASFGDY